MFMSMKIESVFGCVYRMSVWGVREGCVWWVRVCVCDGCGKGVCVCVMGASVCVMGASVWVGYFIPLSLSATHSYF